MSGRTDFAAGAKLLETDLQAVADGGLLTCWPTDRPTGAVEGWQIYETDSKQVRVRQTSTVDGVGYWVSSMQGPAPAWATQFPLLFQGTDTVHFSSYFRQAQVGATILARGVIPIGGVGAAGAPLRMLIVADAAPHEQITPPGDFTQEAPILVGSGTYYDASASTLHLLDAWLDQESWVRFTENTSTLFTGTTWFGAGFAVDFPDRLTFNLCYEMGGIA